jgi:hypothetical protein
MAAHSGSDTLRLHRVGPSPCASALALDTRHRPVMQMRTFTPRASLNKHAGRVHPRWAITGASNYAKPG